MKKIDNYKRKKIIKKVYHYIDIYPDIVIGESLKKLTELIDRGGFEESCNDIIPILLAGMEKDGIYTEKFAEQLGNNQKTCFELLGSISRMYPQVFLDMLGKEAKISKNICAYYGQVGRILLGGGKAEYNVENKRLTISGYYLPTEAYDKVDIYMNHKLLGTAELSIKRPDVYGQFPNWHNVYCGWNFSSDIDRINGEEVEVCVKLKGQIVKKEVKKVNIVSGVEKRSDIKRYKIDIQKLFDENNAVYERVRRFNEACVSLQEFFEWEEPEFYKKYLTLKNEIMYGKRKIEELLLSIFCDEEKKIIYFRDAQIAYQDISRLWTIIDELLIKEEYYFETDNSKPYIIDGGANIGLAVYYFKKKFPLCKILAFEPSEEAFSILKQNILVNKWENVEALPYALDLEKETRILYVPINDCLGASLTKRPYEYNDDEQVKKEYITTQRLNDFIDSDVDFLKLDVEGVETRIIRELGNKLKQVKHIFLEYHYGNMVEDNNLLELLSLLEKQGIIYQITKSPGFAANTAYRTMNYVGEKYSLNIWGRQL